MSMNEYEISLAKDAMKGKRKALKLLIESYHDHLVDIVERELHSRDQAEKVIKNVKKKAKIEAMLLRDPMDFERMIEDLTIAECANDIRGNDHQRPVAPGYTEKRNEQLQMPIGRREQEAYRPADAPQRPGSDYPSMQNRTPAALHSESAAPNNGPAAAPFRPAVPNNGPAAAPFRPAVPNNGPAAAPFRPAASNNGSVSAQFRPAVQNNAADESTFRPVTQNNGTSTPVIQNRERHVKDRFAQNSSVPGANPAYRAPEPPRNRASASPIEFRSVNMDNATPRVDASRTPVHNIPHHPNERNSQAFSRPIQQNPWHPPYHYFDDNSKTELLAKEPSVDVRTAPYNQPDDTKTELLTEEPKAEGKTTFDNQPDDAKTELLTEESKRELPQEEPKTELLKENSDSTSDGEPKTELLPETKTERMPQPQNAPAPEPKTVPDGELLFKPDQKLQPSETKAPETSDRLNIPKVGLLVCVKGENAGENFSLFAGRNRVGVTEYCDVQINDDSLTEDYNFEIIYDEKRESFTLVPGKLSSRLFVNDDYVDSAVFIRSHDTIRTGNSAFLLVSFQ